MNKKPILVNKDCIKNNDINVATYNADPFSVEEQDTVEEVLRNTNTWVEKYTNGTDGFQELCEKLDGDIHTYKAIYVSEKVMFGTLK